MASPKKSLTRIPSKAARVSQKINFDADVLDGLTAYRDAHKEAYGQLPDVHDAVNALLANQLATEPKKAKKA